MGFAPGPLDATSTLKLRINSNGGTGKVAWLPTPAAEAPRPAEFSIKAGDWTELTSPIPALPDKAGILRIFLPGDAAAIDWIELTSGGKKRRRDF